MKLIIFRCLQSWRCRSSYHCRQREPGLPKDSKTAEAQVVLGLLVSAGDSLLSYSLFNGTQYEGFTMIPVIDSNFIFVICHFVNDMSKNMG